MLAAVARVLSCLHVSALDAWLNIGQTLRSLLVIHHFDRLELLLRHLLHAGFELQSLKLRIDLSFVSDHLLPALALLTFTRTYTQTVCLLRSRLWLVVDGLFYQFGLQLDLKLVQQRRRIYIALLGL